ncbi:DNA N-6-adenine-methyltransferase [Sphingomonas sp. 1P06PA]|uniref:DNA N-6-adenine-methyltransferase n=1 Tax=Sphingomonas sp. 1P06PA TaxID=554121 RepID=UPI0039A6CC99
MSAWENQGGSDEWYTPPHVFEALGCRFDLDVAAPAQPTHVPADGFICAGSLDAPWRGFVWMNPPFGGRNAIVPWLDRFFAHGNGIALTPDRTSAPWFWEAWRKADAVLFTRKIRFIRPDGTEGKSPSCGTALFASGNRGVLALRRAESAGLGILAQPIGIAA